MIHFALLDTGASIPVMPSRVAADLNVTFTVLENLTRVSMANGAIKYTYQVADLEPIIGLAAVLKSAAQTLIGLDPLMDQGNEVHFSKPGVGIFLHNELVYKCFCDSQRKSFQINIMDLVLPSSTPYQPQIYDDMLIGSNTPLRLSPDAHVGADTGMPATTDRHHRSRNDQRDVVAPQANGPSLAPGHD